MILKGPNPKLLLPSELLIGYGYPVQIPQRKTKVFRTFPEYIYCHGGQNYMKLYFYTVFKKRSKS